MLHEVYANINSVECRMERFETSHADNSKLMKEELNEHVEITMETLLSFKMN
jgi:hypothetical protein